MFELVYDEAGSERVIRMTAGSLTVGRAAACDVVLQDPGVAPRHASLVAEGDRWRVIDLEGTAGTYVNGVRITQEWLGDGDEIRVGSRVLRFRDARATLVLLDASQPLLEPAVIRNVAELQRALEDQAPRDLEKANRILRSLSELAHALISAEPEDVPRRVMDVVFEHTPADRGFLMLYDDLRNLRPRVVKHRHPAPEGGITISKTIAERVVRDRVAILTSDALVEPRFSGQSSVRSFSIRSAMCVPLWQGDTVTGIIHVDTTARTNSFGEADLELLSALANFAAVAIEQARLSEKIQTERLARERLEKYFSPAIVARILSEGEQDVRELEATVLFADIVGFTRMAERLGPPAIAEMLNSYFSCMVEVILEHDGTVDKFVGDGIMAVFGAPYPQDDHAPRAVRVALEMRRRLGDLNRVRQGQPPIQIRIGINTGRVVAGPIGPPKRREITVLGDAVNVASRIESSISRAGAIVVGPRTFELVKDQFVLADLGTVALRGKKQEVNVYEVLTAAPV